MIARMSYVEDSAVVEFSTNNKRIYYFLLSEESVENKSDLDIINEAVEYMRVDKERWIENCETFIENSNKFILYERVSLYKIVVDENAEKKHCVIVSITEENDKFILRFKDEALNTITNITMTAENRKSVIDTLEKLGRVMLGTLDVFRAEQEQIILNTFGTDYALQKGLGA